MSRDTIQLSLTALFRYRLVSEVETRVLAGAGKSEVIRRVAARQHAGPDGAMVTLSPRTLYRWCSAYGRHGYRGLEAEPRRRVEASAVLPQALVDFLSSEKVSDQDASIPELVLRARLRGVIAEDERICRTTVWRACQRLGLPLQRRRVKDRDMRSFAYPHRMMMVLADGKHFRAGVTRAKRVAVTFLDDATRFGLGLVVGSSESTELFLRGLYDVIRHHGLMNVLYLDHGPGFASGDTGRVVAQLDRSLIHGAKAYPEGHGKIEKYHQPLKSRALRGLDRNPEVDPDLGALTLRLRHWLINFYNHNPHEGLDGESPAERWQRDTRALVLPPSQAWLDDRFLVSLQRRVTATNSISYLGGDYEIPQGHAGERIDVYRHLLDGDRLSIVHRGRRVFLEVVDRVRNAYDRRAHTPADAEPPEEPPQTAADLAYRDEFGSIVGADGGYPEGDTDDR